MFRRKKEIFYVGKVKIIINESTLDVFRNTIYYVDVQNALCIKGVPFITCDIYEDEFSDHLIAQVGLEDDEENDILPSIEELKNKKIVCFIQLDEHIIRQNCWTAQNYVQNIQMEVIFNEYRNSTNM